LALCRRGIFGSNYISGGSEQRQGKIRKIQMAETSMVTTGRNRWDLFEKNENESHGKGDLRKTGGEWGIGCFATMVKDSLGRRRPLLLSPCALGTMKEGTKTKAADLARKKESPERNKRRGEKRPRRRGKK